MPPPYDWNAGKDGCIAGFSPRPHFINPDGIKWVITYQRGRCKYPNFEWECDTDVPILLFALVGIHPPWKKKGVHIKRGVVSHHDPYVHFPYRAIVCQNEKGQTTHHTFTWEVPGDDEVFWWVCRGRGQPKWYPFSVFWSASTSPFYNSKCKKPPDPVPTSDCQPYQASRVFGAQYSNATGQSFRPDHAYYARKLAIAIHQWNPDLKGSYLIKITKAALPCYAEPVLWSYKGNSTDLPPPGATTWLHFTLPYILLEPPNVYHVVIHSVPNWVKWDGMHWVDWGSGAAIGHWVGDIAHDYPRGDWLTGCDFKDDTGPWIIHVGDLSFCIYE